MLVGLVSDEDSGGFERLNVAVDVEMLALQDARFHAVSDFTQQTELFADQVSIFESGDHISKLLWVFVYFQRALIFCEFLVGNIKR